MRPSDIKIACPTCGTKRYVRHDRRPKQPVCRDCMKTVIRVSEKHALTGGTWLPDGRGIVRWVRDVAA